MEMEANSEGDITGEAVESMPEAADTSKEADAKNSTAQKKVEPSKSEAEKVAPENKKGRVGRALRKSIGTIALSVVAGLVVTYSEPLCRWATNTWHDSSFDECKNAIVKLYDGADKLIANGFLVSEGGTTYVYTARHPIIADYGHDKQFVTNTQIRADIYAVLGHSAKRLPLMDCEILNSDTDGLSPWHDVARYAIATNIKESLLLPDCIITNRHVKNIRLLVYNARGTYLEGGIRGAVKGLNENGRFVEYTLNDEQVEQGFSGGAVLNEESPCVVIGVHSGTTAGVNICSLIGKADGRDWVRVPLERLIGYDEYYEKYVSYSNRIASAENQSGAFYFTEKGTLAFRDRNESTLVYNNAMQVDAPEKYYKRRIGNLEKRAARGQIEDMVALGEAYCFGWGVEVNYKAAKDWFRKAAKKGDLSAKYYLAQMQLDDVESSQADIDIDSAILTLIAEIKKGRTCAAYPLAQYYERKSKSPLALRLARIYYRIAAENGMPLAQLAYGRFLLYGYGGMMDPWQSTYWIGKAADSDDPSAVCYLAYCYECGIGVAQDLMQAAFLYSRFVRDGLAEKALGKYAKQRLGVCLGICFSRGIGVNRDINKALMWLHTAAYAGDAYAQRRLGIIYWDADAGVQNLSASDYWIREAARSGDDRAQMFVGVNAFIGDVGKGAPILSSAEKMLTMKYTLINDLRMRADKLKESGARNDKEKEGWDYLKSLAESGNVIAQLLLCISDCARGDGVASARWASKAANSGSIEGKYLLALCYEDGFGVEQDMSMAVSLLKQVSDAGYPPGQVSYGDCYYYGDGVKQDFGTAVYWYRKAADNGDPYGQLGLGICYRDGVGVEKSATEAVRWFSLSAKQSHPSGQRCLGDCYRYGIGVEIDNDKAYEWYRKSAEQGDSPGQWHLGDCYREGVGVEKDAGKACDWYRKSAEQGDSYGQCGLGDCYRYGIGVEKDEGKAYEWYCKSAEQGNSDGQWNLGDCYYYGIGIGRDNDKAYEWYKKSAEQGNAIGQRCLGDCYRYGIGVEVNNSKAYDLYCKSAEQEDADGQWRLGDCYRYGIGVDKDGSKAFEWYKKSAEQENSYGQCCLGDCYREGVGVEKDAGKACDWYRKSAEQGNSNGQCCLGDCYRDGIGVEKSDSKAFEWYRKSAEQGNPDGQWHLGECYRYGVGVDKDGSKAFEWYSKSAEQGNPIGQCCLGLCFGNGIGVEVNEETAFQWYKKSAEQGDSNGQMALANGFRFGIGVNKDAAEAIRWFNASAKQDHPNGYAGLGECYLNGVGVPKDEALAFEWISKSAEQGLPYGIALLGDCYLCGAGVDKDVSKALELYRKSVDTNNPYEYAPYGFECLARCYARGIGVGRDSKAAFELYMKATELDSADACFAVGWCYENGFGVEKNDQEADVWYRKVGNRHLEITKEELDEFLESAD